MLYLWFSFVSHLHPDKRDFGQRRCFVGNASPHCGVVGGI